MFRAQRVAWHQYDVSEITHFCVNVRELPSSVPFHCKFALSPWGEGWEMRASGPQRQHNQNIALPYSMSDVPKYFAIVWPMS